MKKNIKIQLDKIHRWNDEISKLYKNNIGDKPKFLYIFDDIGDCTRDTFNNITNISRHANMSFIFLIHKYEHLDPTTRRSLSHYIIIKNIAYEEILKDFTQKNKDKLIEFKKYIDDIEYKNNQNENRIDFIYILLETNDSSKIKYFKLEKEDAENVKKSLFLFSTLSELKYNLIKSIKKEIQSIN